MKRMTAAAFLIALAACGGSSTNGPTDVPPDPPPPPAPVVIDSRNGVEVPPLVFWHSNPYTVSETGRIDMTLDWTHAENDLDPMIIRGECSLARFLEDDCDVVALSASDVKPEKISGNVTPGGYSSVVINWGPGEESFSFQVVFQQDATAAASRVKSSMARKGRPTSRIQ